jgi:uncharacterized protein DUF4411
VQVWVIDTSSIINIRQIPRASREKALTYLSELVSNDLLFFPPEVLGELGRHNEKSDDAYTWAKKNSGKATRHGRLYDEAKGVLRKLPNLIDPEKVSDVDVADPYVIALAQLLKVQGCVATIITNDTHQYPKKTALSSAAGVFGFPSIPLLLFLQTQEIFEM